MKTNLIIIDDFYGNPDEVRKFALQQPFDVKGNYPGQRTKSYITPGAENTIKTIVKFHSGSDITYWPDNDYNGAFQYTTQKDRSWYHVDPTTNWAGIVYLTPKAPLSGGTSFHRSKIDGTMYSETTKTLVLRKYSQDNTKWECVDKVGNVYNRLILFNSKRYHISDDYWGEGVHDGRLFQTFFFSTEK